MRSRAHVFFKGRVQGVFFRDTTARFARNSDVTGWVKNLPDGRVEAVFEGDRGRVEKVINLCITKQPSANVRDYSVDWESYSGDFSEFSIVY